jgi:hypothetical protein
MLLAELPSASPKARNAHRGDEPSRPWTRPGERDSAVAVDGAVDGAVDFDGDGGWCIRTMARSSTTRRDCRVPNWLAGQG